MTRIEDGDVELAAALGRGGSARVGVAAGWLERLGGDAGSLAAMMKAERSIWGC
jgi:hypothetical protein